MPAPRPLAKGKPEAQAKMLADAMADPRKKLQAWLDAYHALGIPILDPEGAPLFSAASKLPDSAGPYFWNIWLTSGLDRPGAGLKLSEAGRVLTVGLDGLDSERAAKLLLGDLRQAANSEDPKTRLFVHLVRERVRRGPSKADILDPNSQTDAVVDLPTLQLIHWVVLRSMVARIAVDSPDLSGQNPTGSLQSPLGVRSAYAAGGFKCDEIFGNKEVTGWINRIVGVAAGGAETGGLFSDVPSIRDYLLKRVGMGESSVTRIGSVASYANAVASAISLAMQIGSLTVEIDSNPLDLTRTKTYQPGKEQHHDITIVSDPEGLPSGDNLRNCLSSFGANVMGVGLNFPADRSPLGGVMVEFTPGEGFDRVHFARASQIKQTADDNGRVSLDIEGRGQKENLPDGAKELELTYSFNISSQVEEEDIGSIGRMFWDSLQAIASRKPPGFAAPVLDLLKVMKWEIGEQSFVLRDWGSQSYKAHGTYQEAVFDGVICDLAKPFALKVTGTGTGSDRYQPGKRNPYSGGTHSMIGKHEVGNFWADGSYKIVGDLATGKGLRLITNDKGCASWQGQVRDFNCKKAQVEIALTPLAGGVCR